MERNTLSWGPLTRWLVSFIIQLDWIKTNPGYHQENPTGLRVNCYLLKKKKNQILNMWVLPETISEKENHYGFEILELGDHHFIDLPVT